MSPIIAHDTPVVKLPVGVAPSVPEPPPPPPVPLEPVVRPESVVRIEFLVPEAELVFREEGGRIPQQTSVPGIEIDRWDAGGGSQEPRLHQGVVGEHGRVYLRRRQVVYARQYAQGVQIGCRLSGVRHEPQIRQNTVQEGIPAPRMVRFLIGQLLVQQQLLVARQTLIKRGRHQQIQLLRVIHVLIHVLLLSNPRIDSDSSTSTTFRALFRAGGALLLLGREAEHFPQSRVSRHLGVLHRQFQTRVIGFRHVDDVDSPLYRRVGVYAGVYLAGRGVILDGLEGEGELT